MESHKECKDSALKPKNIKSIVATEQQRSYFAALEHNG